MRNRIAKLIALIPPALLALGTVVPASGEISGKRPNIVLFYTDDQSYHALGSVEPYFHTPHTDRFAAEEIVFHNAFVTTAVCAVSRANLLTGQHMKRHRIDSFDRPLSKEQMEQSFPGLLRDAGYRTAFLGKFAIGHPRSAPQELCLPEEQFDLWYGFLQALSYSQEVDGQERYVTSVMEEKAISFMRDTGPDQPFLVIMSLPEPHGQGGKGGPWNYRDPDFELDPPAIAYPAPKTMTVEGFASRPSAIQQSRNGPRKENDASFQERMAIRRHYIARTDLAVGRILQALEDLELNDNTVVIFTSDHGSMWGAHGLRGKWNMYEESIRVPLIIRDPRLPATLRRGVRNQMALSIDLAPTMLSVANVPIPEEMQGTDLTLVLRNPDEAGRTDWYYEHDVGTASTGAPLGRCEGVRTERWKYIRYKDTQPVQEELFDLDADPLEENNLAGDARYAEILIDLRERCDTYAVTLR